MAAAVPCFETSVGRALAAARERLGLADLVIDVYQSPGMRCPVIWCWGQHPRLVLPLAAVETLEFAGLDADFVPRAGALEATRPYHGANG